MRKFINNALLVLAVCILTACEPKPSAVFQDESCLPPCWNKITPGKTIIQEVNAKLKTISAVDSKSIKTMSILRPNDSIYFNFLPNVRESGGEIISQDGIVQAISFSPKSNKLLLSEVIQEWGPPNQYISTYYSKAEIPYLATSIFYTKQGIILNSIRNMRAEEVPKFDNNFPIQSIWYTNPTSTFDPLKNGLIDFIDNQDLLDGLKPWTGLGEINYIKRDLFGVK